jgi:hypothetical protein
MMRKEKRKNENNILKKIKKYKFHTVYLLTSIKKRRKKR